MSVLIIFTSSTPLSPFHLHFLSSRTYAGLPEVTFWRKDRKRNSREVLKARTVTGRSPSATLIISQHSACVSKTASPLWECDCMCVCVFNFHKLRFRLKWLAWGWWSVALPSSLSCRPLGERTNARSYRDTISQAYEHAQKHVDTLRPWDRQCPGLVYVCLPVSRCSSW